MPRTVLPDSFYEEPEERTFPPLPLFLIRQEIAWAWKQEDLDIRLLHFKRAFVSLHQRIEANELITEAVINQIHRESLWPERLEPRYEYPYESLPNLRDQARILNHEKVGVTGFLKWTQREIDWIRPPDCTSQASCFSTEAAESQSADYTVHSPEYSINSEYYSPTSASYYNSDSDTPSHPGHRNPAENIDYQRHIAQRAHRNRHPIPQHVTYSVTTY
jgi:hypothetical protein